MIQGRRAALAGWLWLLAALLPAAALAQQAFSVPAPPSSKEARVETFKATGLVPALRIELGVPAAGQVDALRERNSQAIEKRLQVGFGRGLAGRADVGSDALAWERVAGGRAARWEIASLGARAIRIALEVTTLPAGAELRFAANDEPATVYGPFAGDALYQRPAYWSPVLEGERGTVEIFLPEGRDPRDVRIELHSLSHLIASPRAADFEKQLKLSGACEVNLICLSATDAALAQTGRAVARMSYIGDDGGSYTCTGTLLATTAGPGANYFYTAAHCISSMAEASSLTTHWNHDYNSCGGMIIVGNYVQLTAGATLLYANTTTDVSLLRLNGTPPGTAIYSGWNVAAFANGTPLTAVHHPAGDAKKVSLGTMGGHSAYGGGPGSTHIIALWNGTSTGVTEGGSSGSGIFTAVGAPATSYQLRGGLHGGPSSCSATGSDLRDYYSRFDNAYPSLRQYLDASCNFSLGTPSASVAAGGTSGSVSVSSAGCAWTAVSDATWLTTASSGGGNGSVSYTVAANTGGSRTGRIMVGSQTFTVTQAAGYSGTDALTNGDFELGPVAWTQTSTSGAALIASEPGTARGGTFDARLGNATSGTDVLYQNVTIPANATTATLRFWRRISSEESGSTVYDTLVVALANPSSGSTLATLVTLSNAQAGGTWVEHTHDLTSYKGQTVRVRFTASNDGSYLTTFRIDDVSVMNVVPVTYPITVTATPTAGGTASCTPNPVVSGSNSTCTATANLGYTLTGWSGDCSGATCVLTNVTSARSVTANFGVSTYAIATAASPGAGGTVSCSPNPVTHGGSSTCTATANPTFTFGGWSGDCTGMTCTFSNVTSAKSVTALFTAPNPPRLSNISTRMQVLTGIDVMIGGFVIGGTSNKTVAIVVTGPSLTAYGITNPLGNPTLTLVRSSDQAVIATNDNWPTASNAAQLSAAGFAPPHVAEAAILVNLAPGAYTAIVQGVGNTTGVAVIGVYEVDATTVPLTNISTRGRVQTGGDVMIGGFVIQGTGPQTVAIVATGPSLVNYGITNPLANPTLTLVRSSDQSVVTSNDDWQSHPNATLLQGAGFAPMNPLESGIYITLQPGAYTAILSGVGGGTGVGVIGVYKVN